MINRSGWWAAAMALVVMGQAGLRAEAKDASEADTQWFVGEWTTGPAPIEGYETIVVAPSQTVTIAYDGGAQISRTSTLRNGRQVSVAFIVKHFGRNYPWWTVDGNGSLVARKVDADTFDLAGVGPMGKADWAGATRHVRVKAKPAADGEAPAKN